MPGNRRFAPTRSRHSLNFLPPSNPRVFPVPAVGRRRHGDIFVGSCRGGGLVTLGHGLWLTARIRPAGHWRRRRGRAAWRTCGAGRGVAEPLTDICLSELLEPEWVGGGALIAATDDGIWAGQAGASRALIWFSTPSPAASSFPIVSSGRGFAQGPRGDARSSSSSSSRPTPLSASPSPCAPAAAPLPSGVGLFSAEAFPSLRPA